MSVSALQRGNAIGFSPPWQHHACGLPLFKSCAPSFWLLIWSTWTSPCRERSHLTTFLQLAPVTQKKKTNNITYLHAWNRSQKKSMHLQMISLEVVFRSFHSYRSLHYCTTCLKGVRTSDIILCPGQARCTRSKRVFFLWNKPGQREYFAGLVSYFIWQLQNACMIVLIAVFFLSGLHGCVSI
jgi:hypothetical protein